jgi:AcrR family transcriptional regulator
LELVHIQFDRKRLDWNGPNESVFTMAAHFVLGRRAEDSAKRRQIIEGARSVFKALGFDAASMGEIAKAARVSKGTLYVYFKDKDELFHAIIENEHVLQADSVFDLDVDEPDVARVLTRMGISLATLLCVPDHCSMGRVVMAIADRKPEAGQSFYQHGPVAGIAKLRAYFETEVAVGRLEIEDCEVAAAQFIEMCLATMLKPMLYSCPPPPPERIAHVVRIAVKTFMAAYGKKS